MGRLRKRWIDIVKDFSKKRGWVVRQEKRMVHDRSECQGVCEGECVGCSPGG